MKVKLTKELYNFCRIYSTYLDYDTLFNNYKRSKDVYYIHLNKRQLEYFENVIENILDYQKDSTKDVFHFTHVNNIDFQNSMFELYYLIENRKQELLDEKIDAFLNKNSKN